MYWWRLLQHRFYLFKAKHLPLPKAHKIILCALSLIILCLAFFLALLILSSPIKEQSSPAPLPTQNITSTQIENLENTQNITTNITDTGTEAFSPILPENPQLIQEYNIVRGVLNQHAIPYNEGASASLQDKIKQIDYALIQSLERLNIPYENYIIQDSFFRILEENVFHSQQIILILPEEISHKEWNRILAEQLELWTHDTALDCPEENGPTSLFATQMLTHTIFYAKNKEEAEKKSLPFLIVIDDMGENTKNLLDLLSLEFPVVISILPYTKNATKVSAIAHAFKRTVLLHQPMEAENNVHNNSQANPFLRNMNPDLLEQQLATNFQKVPEAIGVNNHTGSAFTSHTESVENFLKALKNVKPNALVLDSFTINTSKLYTLSKPLFSSYKRNTFLDNVRKKEQILIELNNTLSLTNKKDWVITIGHPYPETISALKEWKTYKKMPSPHFLSSHF